MKDGKDLVAIIRAHPGCVATIDNDCWWLTDGEGNELANDGDIEPLGDGGYGSGSCYGGDVLQALARIVGVRIESV